MSTRTAVAPLGALLGIPLTDRSAKAVIDLVVEALAGVTATGVGAGYVICAGGRYARYAYATCRWMREELGDEAPIEIWAGSDEEIVNFGIPGIRYVVANVPGGWPLKARAVKFSAFQDVTLLDADCLPRLLCDSPEVYLDGYGATGALFFRDVKDCRRDDWAFPILGLRIGSVPEMEAGQLVIDRVRHARAVALVDYFNQRPEFFYRHLHGDKDLWALAFARLGIPYSMGAPCTAETWGLRHYLSEGTPFSDHLIGVKSGRQHSEIVRGYLEEYAARFVV
jgi:hypothetical protein